MTLDEVKEKFKKAYARPWIELVDEHEDELLFKVKGGTMFRAPPETLMSFGF